MISSGYLDKIVDLSQLDGFWKHFCKDYPRHPASSCEPGDTPVPISLYGYVLQLIRSFSCVY